MPKSISAISGTLFAGFGIDDDGHGAIVDETDEHLSTEFSGLDRLAEILPKSFDKVLVERNREFGSSRTAVGRAIAFSCAGEKSELADEKNVALRFLDGAVHDPVLVIEDSKANDFSAEPFDVFGRIGFFDGEQNEQALLNRGFDCSSDLHFGF